MARIYEERRLVVLRNRLIIFFLGFTGSAVALIPIFKMVQKGFIESGFFEFLSLLFSDIEIVTAYWQNFAMSLLESLPLMSLIMFSAVVLIFLEFLKLLVKDLKVVSSLKQFARN